MTGKQSADVINDMVDRIVRNFNPDKIILFGSFARGTPGPDSDVDLLVVMQVAGSKRDTAIEIDLILADSKLPKDVIVVTPDELEKYRDMAGTVIYPAIREGKILYERAA
jgi:uncharacterized protein